MISLVVASRNRAYTLRRVLPSFFEQEGVSEIVLVSDGSTDDTEAVFRQTAEGYPQVRSLLLFNEQRLGAPGSRNRGARAATNEFILFSDDDEFLEQGYAATCLDILLSRDAGIVSGRRIYLLPGESSADALARFGSGRLARRAYSPHLLFLINEARFSGEVSQPIASAVMLTRRSTVLQTPFDEHYGRANGYREESDFQVRVFLGGADVVMTDRVHSFHLPMAEVATGGQRTSRATRIKGMVSYTSYFYDKVYDDYAAAVGIATPRWVAKGLFAGFAVAKVGIAPWVSSLAGSVRRLERRIGIRG